MGSGDRPFVILFPQHYAWMDPKMEAKKDTRLDKIS